MPSKAVLGKKCKMYQIGQKAFCSRENGFEIYPYSLKKPQARHVYTVRKVLDTSLLFEEIVNDPCDCTDTVTGHKAFIEPSFPPCNFIPVLE